MIIRRSSLAIIATTVAVSAATILPISTGQQHDTNLLSSRVNPHPDSIHLPLCAVSNPDAYYPNQIAFDAAKANSAPTT